MHDRKEDSVRTTEENKHPVESMTQNGVTLRTHTVQTIENEHPVDSDNELKNEHPVGRQMQHRGIMGGVIHDVRIDHPVDCDKGYGSKSYTDHTVGGVMTNEDIVGGRMDDANIMRSDHTS